jgi:hypothetical protein
MKKVFCFIPHSFLWVTIVSSILSFIIIIINVTFIIYVTTLIIIFVLWVKDIEGNYSIRIFGIILIPILTISMLVCLMITSFSVFHFVFCMLSCKTFEGVLSVGLTLTVGLIYSCLDKVLKKFQL